MSTQPTLDELYLQLQNEEITWLDFARRSEYAEEYRDWCREVDLSENEDSAVLFFEKKDFDSLTSSPHPENLPL